MAGMLTEGATVQQARLVPPCLLQSRVILINMDCVGLFDTAPQPTGTHPASQSETTAMTMKENAMSACLATSAAVTPPAHAGAAPDALLAGALDHLLRYALTGCDYSARHAAYLLDHLAEHPEVRAQLRANCERMSGALAAPDFVAAWRRSH